MGGLNPTSHDKPAPRAQPERDPTEGLTALVEFMSLGSGSHVAELSGNAFIDEVNRIDLGDLLGTSNDNHPRLWSFVDLCLKKNTFSSNKAGIKKDQLVVIMHYMDGSNNVCTGGNDTKNVLNFRIKEWYDTDNNKPPTEQPPTDPTPPPTTQALPWTKLEVAREIKATNTGWKHVDLKYKPLAHALFAQAFRVGLFDEDHVNTMWKAANYDQFLFIQDLDVLAKQMGTVFGGKGLISKSKAARDHAIGMGLRRIGLDPPSTIESIN
eukprot:scaffold6120_cov162-Amphora_coffeaeformis.AAC.1